MMELYIIKRDGKSVVFDRERIKRAVSKAVAAGEEKLSQEAIDSIVTSVADDVYEKFADSSVHVEQIQDLVEKHLMQAGLFDVAKRYIIYRAKRHEKRNEEKREILERSLKGKINVRKRDGKTVHLDVDKIRSTLKRARAPFKETIDEDFLHILTKEVLKNMYEGIPTSEIEDAMILAVSSFIERDPNFSFMTSRIFLQKIYKEVFGKSVSDKEVSHEYRKSFINGIKKGVENKLLNDAMLSFNLEELSKHLRPENDSIVEYMGIKTLFTRYFVKHDEISLELPQTFLMRVAMGLSIGEKEQEKKAIEFYNMMSTLRYVPSTPTLFHAGTNHPQLSSCYLTTVIDDLGHIFKCMGDNAQLSKWSGGLGNDWTYVRATGARIKSTGVESQGVIPFLKIANDVTAAINRSGKRRGATCAYLETWHLDIDDFLDLRRNTGDERRRTHDMNTANWIPDLFMKRVIADQDWTLFSPEETPELHDLYGKAFERKYVEYEEKAKAGKVKKVKTVKAKDMWRKMITRLFETGHPWITFKDPCNIRSPQDHVGVIHSSNLCTEITLNTSTTETAVCNLGSINLTEHITAGKLDERKLAETVKVAMRMLDNVVDLNYYPTVEAKDSNMKHRPVGLGIMGLQDALFLTNIAFESEEGLRFADRSMEVIAYNAIMASSELAKERGAYSSYSGSKWDRGLFPQDTVQLLEDERGISIPINKDESMDWAPVREHVKKHGMRNSNTMAIAPTATISTIAGCYPSFEPIYKNIYVKSNVTGEFTVVNSYLVKDLKAEGIWNTDTLELLKFHDGNLASIDFIPDRLRRKYKEAFDIDPVHQLKMTAVRGKWIDQSQSHNIFIQGSSGKLLSEVYIQAWKLGLKTTYYLRSLAKSQIEKSTVDAAKYGFTQKRSSGNVEETKQVEAVITANVDGSKTVTVEETDELVLTHVEEKPALVKAAAKTCLIENPDCEACQ